MKKTIKRELEVQPLMTPNFILVGDDRKPVPIREFSREEIDELCQDFTKEMHKKRLQPASLH